MTEDEMDGCHHQLNGHESEQTQGDSEGQGSLVCCSPCGHQGSDVTEPHDSANLESSYNFTYAVMTVKTTQRFVKLSRKAQKGF